MDVKGLSINQILNMEWEDVQKLSRKDLAKITSRLVSSANKRLRRLEQSTLGESPAYRSVKARTGDVRFSVKGRNQGQLQNVFSEAKHFLNLKSSTVGGYKKVVKNIKRTISEKTGRQVATLDVAKLYNALHKGQEMGLIDGRGSKGSEYAVGQIIELLERNPNKSVDDIVDDLNDWYSEMYEEDYDEDEEYDDVYFDDEF